MLFALMSGNEGKRTLETLRKNTKHEKGVASFKCRLPSLWPTRDGLCLDLMALGAPQSPILGLEVLARDLAPTSGTSEALAVVRLAVYLAIAAPRGAAGRRQHNRINRSTLKTTSYSICDCHRVMSKMSAYHRQDEKWCEMSITLKPAHTHNIRGDVCEILCEQSAPTREGR